MKKLILLMILFPAIAFSQENLQKSAESFITSFLQAFETKNYDLLLNSIDANAQIITTLQTVRPLINVTKSMVEDRKKNVTSEKIDIKSVSAEVLSPTIAVVTASYIQTTDRSGNVSVLDNLDTFLLEMKDGTWKLRKYIPNFGYPVIFDQKIDKKFQTGKIGYQSRINGEMNQLGAMFAYDLEYSIKNGITPAQLGKRIGERFAKTWDQSRGFAGLVSGFMWGVQLMSTYVEVLERNDETFKVKFEFVKLSDTWDVTKEDLLEMSQNIWGEIANWMGGTCSLTADGKFWILTLNKK